MRPFDKNFGAVPLAVILVMISMSPAIAQPAPPPPPKASSADPLQKQYSPGDVQIDKQRSKKLTLLEALNLANKNNREIAAARLGIQQSTAAVGTAQASDGLGLNFSSSLGNSGAPLFTTQSNNLQSRAGNGTNLQGGLEATYSLNNTLFGQTNNLAAAGKQQVEFSKLDVDRVARKVQDDVIKAYYDLQDADEQLKINQAAVRNAQESLRNARIQEKAGLGTKFDVIRADVQKSTAEQDVVRIESQQQVARKSIAQILNVSENVEYSAAEPIAMKGQWQPRLEDSVAQALNSRPELKQQKIQRDISNFRAKGAENIPQYSLFANYSLGKDLGSAAGFGDNYSVGARINFSLLDGGAAGSRTEQERVGASIAETQYVRVRDQVRLQVEQSYLSLESNKKNIGTAKGAQAQAQESLRLARLRLAAGVGTQLDVINADTELTRAKSNYSRAIVNYNRDLSTLRNAVSANP